MGERLDSAVIELGYVLKAIEELSVEKGVMSRTEIQNKILELTEQGWVPESFSGGQK
jgi:hypothetical protein